MIGDSVQTVEGIPQDSHSQDQDRSLGFWLYLMSDAIIFALLFATYAVMIDGHGHHGTARPQSSLANAFAETLLLLTSTLTFGLAAVAVHRGRQRVLLWLLATFVLGAAFLGLELRELDSLVAQGSGPSRNGSLSAFFTLIGTHGLHVSAGLVWILVLSVQIYMRGLESGVVSRLYRLGLFWHFLDIIWIGIFSVVYLPGAL